MPVCRMTNNYEVSLEDTPSARTASKIIGLLLANQGLDKVIISYYYLGLDLLPLNTTYFCCLDALVVGVEVIKMKIAPKILDFRCC